MLDHFRCQDCLIAFDNQQSLNTHKLKFCLNSKYADLDTLNQQYNQLHQGKPPAKSPLQRSKFQELPIGSNASRPQQPKNIDRQYRQLLRQIGDRQDLRNRLEREKITAEEEMSVLEKKENEIFVNARKKELEEMIQKRQEMARQEDQIHKEIKNFERQMKEENKTKQLKDDEDYDFRQGREAGKLAMQRRLLQEKKRQIQGNLKLKRRQQQRVYKEIDDIRDRPVYIPDFKKKQSIAQPKKMYTQPQELSSPTKLPQYPNQQKPPTPKDRQRNRINQAESILRNGAQQPFQQSNASKRSLVSQPSDDILKAALFAGHEKTLFQSLNPKNKSDEDIFIESLVAQQYDALNLLARLPKDSELYSIKLKQFQEMTKIRQDLKDKVHKVRLDKVRREFQMQKQMTQTEKQNLQWLDKNRQHMLNREVDILKQNNIKRQLENESPNNLNPIDSTLPGYTPPLRNPYSSHPETREYPRGDPSINNIPDRISESQQGRRGYKMVVRSVKNYLSRSPMCVKLAILEQAQQSNGKWVFTTKYHDESATKDQRNPYNPGVRNRLDEAGNVIFNQIFEINQDIQSYYNRTQNQLYLWIMLMEKDQVKLSNEPDLYLWYCFKLTHFGNVREGSFTLSLYHDSCPFPYPHDMNRLKAKANQEIIIELSETINVPQTKRAPQGPEAIERISTTSIGKTIRNTKTAARGGRSMKVRPTEKKINTLQNIKQNFFIQNQEASDFQPVKADDSLSFNFKINGLRILPSYIGPIKIRITYINSDNDEILDSDEVLADFGIDMYNPTINYTKSIKNKEIPSSATAVIKIMAISTLSYTPGLLGFALFHFGFDEEGNPLQQDIPNFFLISGHFQIPLYWGNIQNYPESEVVARKYPQIPCSSLLVSIGQNLPNNPPDYLSGSYNTIFFQVNQMEYRLFQEQAKRQKLKTLDYIQGYYKFKGVKISDYKPEQLKKLIGQALAFNLQNVSNLHTLQAMAEYNSAFGVKLVIDGAIIPPQESGYYYFFTACLYPPAKFYSEKEMDLNFIYSIDLAGSLTSHLLFKQETQHYLVNYSASASVIIELNRIKLNQKGEPDSPIQTCAYNVVPLFDLAQEFPSVDIGKKQIRLLDGQFDQKELKNLQNNSVRYFQLMQGQKKTDFSVVLRVLNGYFGNQWNRQKTGSKGKPLRSIFNNSKGFKSAQSSVLQIIQKTYGVSNI